MHKKASPKMNPCSTSTPPRKCESVHQLDYLQPRILTSWRWTPPNNFKLSNAKLLPPHVSSCLTSAHRWSKTLGAQVEHTSGRVTNPRSFTFVRRSPVDVSSHKRVWACTALAELVLECRSVSRGGESVFFVVVAFLPNRQIALGRSSSWKRLIPPPATLK